VVQILEVNTFNKIYSDLIMECIDLPNAPYSCRWRSLWDFSSSVIYFDSEFDFYEVGKTALKSVYVSMTTMRRDAY
jgi:hypothetical protein